VRQALLEGLAVDLDLRHGGRSWESLRLTMARVSPTAGVDDAVGKVGRRLAGRMRQRVTAMELRCWASCQGAKHRAVAKAQKFPGFASLHVRELCRVSVGLLPKWFSALA
jgi:hypothetical protein